MGATTCQDLMANEVNRSGGQCPIDTLTLDKSPVGVNVKLEISISATTAVLPTVSGSDVSGESVDHNPRQPGKATADGRSLVGLWGPRHEGLLDTLPLSSC